MTRRPAPAPRIRSAAGWRDHAGGPAGARPASYVLALRFTPVEARQGLAQKIFYVHVPVGLVRAAGVRPRRPRSILYLWLSDRGSTASPRPRPRSASVFCAGDAHHRPDLGQADLGHLVDLGRAAHADAVPVLPLRSAIWRCGPRCTIRGERARFSAVVGIMGAGAGAVHPPERVPVPHPASAADRAQAERAVAAARRCCGRCCLVRRCSRCCMSGS